MCCILKEGVEYDTGSSSVVDDVFFFKVFEGVIENFILIGFILFNSSLVDMFLDSGEGIGNV